MAGGGYYQALRLRVKYPPTDIEENSCLIYIIKQWDNVALKDYFNSFTPATITIFSSANPARVARGWITKDIRSLGSQSEPAFIAIHCFSICLLLWILFFSIYFCSNNESTRILTIIQRNLTVVTCRKPRTWNCFVTTKGDVKLFGWACDDRW